MRCNKPRVRDICRSEVGFVLPIVLVLLVVGTLLLAPTLSHGFTALQASQTIEVKAHELNAADAGVEDAIHWILSDPRDARYDIGGTPWARNSAIDVFEASVSTNVTIELEGQYYVITSTAASPSGSTQVVAYISILYADADYSGLLDSAITSNDSVTIQPNNSIYGDISMPEDGALDNKGTVEGDTKTHQIDWPSAEFFKAYYLSSLEDEAPYTIWTEAHSPLTISGTSSIAPYDGLSPAFTEAALTVRGRNQHVKLDGTLYVSGDFSIEGQGNHSISLDLNGHTIFAEGSITVSPNVTVIGPGCIIAVGNIDFSPNIGSGSDAFILIMSVEGTTTLKPGSTLYGSVVGNTHVQLQPNCELRWVSPYDSGINFPMGNDGSGSSGASLSVESYTVS